MPYIKNNNIFYFLNNELMEFENCFKKDISYIGKKSFLIFHLNIFFFFYFFAYLKSLQKYLHINM